MLTNKSSYALIHPGPRLYAALFSNYQKARVEYAAVRHTADCILLGPEHKDKLRCINNK